MTEINGRKFQTITFDEQSKILDYLDKARDVILKKEVINQRADYLQTHINKLFHEVQTAETGEL